MNKNELFSNAYEIISKVHPNKDHLFNILSEIIIGKGEFSYGTIDDLPKFQRIAKEINKKHSRVYTNKPDLYKALVMIEFLIKHFERGFLDLYGYFYRDINQTILNFQPGYNNAKEEIKDLIK